MRTRCRVVTVPTEADDSLTVRQHLSTVLLAQGDGLFRGRTKRHAIAQAEEWLQQVKAPVPALQKQRMGALTVLQRRIVDLSATAVQKPGLIIVEEADADLDTAAFQRLGFLCQRLVQASGKTSLILVGQRVGLLVSAPVPELESTEPAVGGAGRRRAGVHGDRSPPPTPTATVHLAVAADPPDGEPSPDGPAPVVVTSRWAARRIHSFVRFRRRAYRRSRRIVLETAYSGGRP